MSGSVMRFFNPASKSRYSKLRWKLRWISSLWQIWRHQTSHHERQATWALVFLHPSCVQCNNLWNTYGSLGTVMWRPMPWCPHFCQDWGSVTPLQWRNSIFIVGRWGLFAIVLSMRIHNHSNNTGLSGVGLSVKPLNTIRHTATMWDLDEIITRLYSIIYWCC